MPICVSGMHRSGTSMVAKMLLDAGLFLGADDDLMPPAVDNPEGFWEHLHFVSINDGVLAQLGGAWDLPPAAPAIWTGPELAGLLEAATRLGEGFAGHEPWGWKDPRNTLTIPFWEAAIGALDHVFVIRNPLEVARSLEKRNSFSLALGLHIWQVYALRFLEATRRENRIITHFDAYFGESQAEVRRLLTFAGLATDDATVNRAAKNVSSRLKHHRLDVSDLLDANVAPAIINLYGTLCREAGWVPEFAETDADDEPPAFQVDAFRPDLPETSVGRFGLWFFAQQQRVRDLEVGIALQELARDELEGRISERDGMVLEREARIADRDARLAERDRTITRLNHDLETTRQIVADMEGHLQGLTEQAQTRDEHEAELRQMLTAAHDQLLFHETEIMGTLGGALARVAPGAPAAIYYRQVLDKVRSITEQVVPAGSTALIANYGDDAFLQVGDRHAVPFPQGDGGVAADYTSVDGDTAISQLETLRAEGAQFLIVPSPAQAWLGRLPALGTYLDQHYPALVHELGTCTIYNLGGSAA